MTATMPTPKPRVPSAADDPAESQRFIDMAREAGGGRKSGGVREGGAATESANQPEKHEGHS
jgi:hypothetical protein